MNLVPFLFRPGPGATALLVATGLAAAALAQQSVSIDASLRDLASPDFRVSDRALSALLAQSGVEIQGRNATRVKVLNLLRRNPERAEEIKAGLIATLEREGAEREGLEREGHAEQAGTMVDPLMTLTDAVSALQDPRAARGLVFALNLGALDGLADICPSAADALIERIHQPDLNSQGASMGLRRQAITALGWCLARPALMQANPGVAAKIQADLLTDLNDLDWSVRDHAVVALVPVRKDPEVRARLQVASAEDPYISSEGAPPGRPQAHYPVREAADESLDAGNDAFLYYVTRTPQTKSCRVQPAAEAPPEQQVIGPLSRPLVQGSMCAHYDPTGQPLSLCWRVQPANACVQ